MLEDFLAQQSDEGRLDSEGCFTLEAAAARRKMARSGLDTSEKGLLRLVQLGVDSLCDEIRIHLSSDGVKLYFANPRRGLLDDPAMGEDLQCSILACMYSGFDYATFTLSNAAWRFDRNTIAPVSRVPPPDGCIAVELGRLALSEMGFWERLRTSLRARTNEYVTFLSHLGYCPIPLVLDGARPYTEERLVEPRALEMVFHGPPDLRCFGVKAPYGDSRSSYLFPLGQSQPEAQNVENWDTFAKLYRAGRMLYPGGLDEPDASCTLGMVYVGTDWPSGGFLDIVERGVLIGRVPWTGPGWLSGVLSGMTLDTDLSGLNLVQNGKVETLEQSLREEVSLAAQQALAEGRGNRKVSEALGPWLP